MEAVILKQTSAENKLSCPVGRDTLAKQRVGLFRNRFFQ